MPESRTITGILIGSSFSAWTTPLATQSHLFIPAKILTKIASTFVSDLTKRNAFATLSGVAPPPISKKFAGSPPDNLIVSIVAIAKPAPLTMQPIFPSRPT